MRKFTLHQPSHTREAVGLLGAHGLAARPLGGGTDLVAGMMRDQIVGSALPYPTHLVDVTTIEDFAGMRFDDGGCVVGAATTLAELAESSAMRAGWPMLADAAGNVASAEIRAIGTVGGNIHQRPRCWFFRAKDFDCIKKGGDICYALHGDSRYNAIFGGHSCYIVHPSDLATALVALDATARIVSAEGERTVSFEDYFVGPRENLVQETVLRPDEMLKEVAVPRQPSGAVQVWEKVNDKGLPTWDFAVVSVAVVATVEDGTWSEGRIVLGGVAPVPYRATTVEQALTGKRVDEAAAVAAETLRALAHPMRHNAYKVKLAETIVERAVRRAAGAGAAEPGAHRDASGADAAEPTDHRNGQQ